MDLTRKELEEHFRNVSDDELVARLGAGTLTPLAQDIAKAEAKRRSIEVPTPLPDSGQEAQELPEDQVLLAAYPQPMDAYIITGFLEDHGIAATVADGNTVLMNQLWSPALGGTRVMVPKSGLQRAKELVAQRDEGKFTLTADETDPPQDSTHVPAIEDAASIAMEYGEAGRLTIKLGWIIVTFLSSLVIAVFGISLTDNTTNPYTHTMHRVWLANAAITICILAIWLRVSQKKFEMRKESEDHEAAPFNARDYFVELRQSGAVYVATRASARKTVGPRGKEIWPTWSSNSRARQALRASRVFAGCAVTRLPLAKFLDELKDTDSITAVGLNWQGKRASGIDHDKTSFLQEMNKHP